MLTIVRGPDFLYFTVAVRQREQGEVTAHADVGAGVDDGADLANQDVTRQDHFARVTLDTAPLRLRIAPVARAPLAFLVRHGCLLPSSLSALAFAPARIAVILSDVNGCRWPALAAVALAALVLEEDDLLAEPLLDDLGLDGHAGDGRLTDLDAAAVIGEQERPERSAWSRRPLELLHAQGFTLADAVLFST